VLASVSLLADALTSWLHLMTQLPKKRSEIEAVQVKIRPSEKHTGSNPADHPGVTECLAAGRRSTPERCATPKPDLDLIRERLQTT
jgi:hypothetical protein